MYTRTSPLTGAWTAYAASAWAFLFAVPSFYWAAGGSLGTETIGRDTDELLDWAAEPWFLVLTGVLKGLAGLLPLALLRLPDSRVRRCLAFLATIGGVLIALYGLLGFVQHALMAAGILETPSALGSAAVRWHLALWDPWWTAGGVLFLLAARNTTTLLLRSSLSEASRNGR